MRVEMALNDTSFQLGDEVSFRIKIVNSYHTQFLKEKWAFRLTRMEGNTEKMILKTDISLSKLLSPQELRAWAWCRTNGLNQRTLKRRWGRRGFYTLQPMDSLGFHKSIQNFYFPSGTKEAFYDFGPSFEPKFLDALRPGHYTIYLKLVGGKMNRKVKKTLTFTIHDLQARDKEEWDDFVKTLYYHHHDKENPAIRLFPTQDSSILWYTSKHPDSPYLKMLFRYVFTPDANFHGRNGYIYWVLLEQLKQRSFNFPIPQKSFQDAYRYLCEMEDYHFMANSDAYLKEWLSVTEKSNPLVYSQMNKVIMQNTRQMGSSKSDKLTQCR
jgi:hypothetical protein